MWRQHPRVARTDKALYLTTATIYVLLSISRRCPMVKTDLAPQVAAIRAFNRFYTRKIGVVDGVASSPFSLAEARVLYELAHGERLTATDIRKELGLDAGY